jgi:hypothetical protein
MKIELAVGVDKNGSVHGPHTGKLGRERVNEILRLSSAPYTSLTKYYYRCQLYGKNNGIEFSRHIFLLQVAKRSA